MVRVRESVSHGSPLGKQVVLLPYQDMTPRYNINFEWYRINEIMSFTAEPKKRTCHSIQRNISFLEIASSTHNHARSPRGRTVQ
jgi:hypothetical protein